MDIPVEGRSQWWRWCGISCCSCACTRWRHHTRSPVPVSPCRYSARQQQRWSQCPGQSHCCRQNPVEPAWLEISLVPAYYRFTRLERSGSQTGSCGSWICVISPICCFVIVTQISRGGLRNMFKHIMEDILVSISWKWHSHRLYTKVWFHSKSAQWSSTDLLVWVGCHPEATKCAKPSF